MVGKCFTADEMMTELQFSGNGVCAAEARGLLRGEINHDVFLRRAGGFMEMVWHGDFFGAWCRADPDNKLCLLKVLINHGLLETINSALANGIGKDYRLLPSDFLMPGSGK